MYKSDNVLHHNDKTNHIMYLISQLDFLSPN